MDTTSITQGIVRLALFDADVPVLHTSEGDYIPIRALCDVLGLPTNMWIGLVCQRFKGDYYAGALRRLPWTAEDQRSRIDWCLDKKQVSRWLMWLNPKHVHGERHEQLMAFGDQMISAAGAAYQHLQDEYASTKRDIYRELGNCQGSQKALAQTQAWLHKHLPHMRDDADEALVELDRIMAQGNALYDAYADALRRVLQEMLNEPVIDAVIVQDRQVVDTKAMPILPAIPNLDEVKVHRDRAGNWLRTEFTGWCEAHDLPVTWHETD